VWLGVWGKCLPGHGFFGTAGGFGIGDGRVEGPDADGGAEPAAAQRAPRRAAGLPADLLLRQAAGLSRLDSRRAVVFAGWRDGRWSILARSSSGADLRLLPDDDYALDEVTGAHGDASPFESWTARRGRSRRFPPRRTPPS
jgi:hypothetical protein